MQATRKPPPRLHRSVIWGFGILILAIAVTAGFAVRHAPAEGPPNLQTAPVVLLMVQDRGCPYCARWEAEVGRSYRLSEEGKFAPLAVRMRGDPEIAQLKKIVYSPTFVMLAYGREVGRIVGYQGSDLFWMELEPLIAKAGFVRSSPVN